jgi:hypothetical protein
MTLQERYRAALIEQGFGEPCSYPYKFRGVVVLRRLNSATSGFYFIGNGGSLRYGKTRTTSKAVDDAFKAKLLAVPEWGGL